jgi:hypothetical protein
VADLEGTQPPPPFAQNLRFSNASKNQDLRPKMETFLWLFRGSPILDVPTLSKFLDPPLYLTIFMSEKFRSGKQYNEVLRHFQNSVGSTETLLKFGGLFVCLFFVVVVFFLFFCQYVLI